MSRRFRKLVSLFACLAVFAWGLADIAAAAEHAFAPDIAAQSADDHHAHGHAPADNPAGGMDHCGLSGCSFAAVAPVPFGTVIHARASGPFLAVDLDAPRSGAAPPLRPPRLT